MITTDEILNNFVDRLEDVMKRNGWNIKQLAENINVPRRTVNSWILKTRVPRIDYLYTIADFLNVTIDYLVGREQ